MLSKGVTIGLITLPLLLNGCGSGDTDHQTGQQQTVPRQATQEDAGYKITNNAAGPVQLGMSSAEILSTFPNVTAKTEQDGEGITWMTLNLKGENLMSVLLDEYDHTAVLIRVTSHKFVTEQGVKVGENLQSAGEKLGGLTEIQWTEIESREFANFASEPANMDFQVMGTDGTAGVYNNNETVTNVAAPSAHIHSIWITQDI
ncbi:MAG: hypothetical protein RI964_550 [Pseudomonadota bacterium]|jgi:hypothetical protein